MAADSIAYSSVTGRLFYAGKFLPNSTNEAYSAIMAAFPNLGDLIIQTKDFEQHREKNRITLGRDGYILADLLSSISHFLPPLGDDDGFATPTHARAMDNVALTRFRVACKYFLRAMSDERHPIVIFIDDVQWADDGSRLLISTLLEDHELRHVLFLIAYCDEEAERTESLLDKSGNADIIDIQVGNLDLLAIEELISYSMGRLPPFGQELCELSKIVESKTKGTSPNF